MTVRIEKNNDVWTVIHSRPEASNAMDPESATALYHAFVEFEQDDSAKVAVFWGEGGSFCAGWDLKYAARLSGAEAVGDYAYELNEDTIASQAPMGPSRLALSKPVIAAIAGPAVAGGMELAVWADIRVMEESSFMGVYCRRWGVPLVDGGTARLPRLIGQGRALDLILTGRRVDADEALRIGLCEYVVEEGAARSKAESLAHDIARFPQDCMRTDRASALNQAGLSLDQALQNEWQQGKSQIEQGLKGAARFAGGLGRSGDFNEI